MSLILPISNYTHMDGSMCVAQAHLHACGDYTHTAVMCMCVCLYSADI